jgi:hypothetical protein
MLAGMKKRVLAGCLWFYASWYGWAILAEFTGLPEVVGPILGVAAAVLFAGDPLGRIWTRSEAPVRVAAPSLSADQPA